jgi:hypothetical protein
MGRLAALVLALVVVGCNPVSPSETPGQSSLPSAASPSPTPLRSPSTWPTVEPSAATVPAHLDLGAIGFWTLEQPMAAVDLSLNYLRIGTLDGRVTRAVTLHNPGNGPVNLPLQPQPVGPAGGNVLYVADDGHQATLHVVSVVSGADTALRTTPAFIAALAIDPTGSTAYVVGLDRTSGVFLEMDAVATVGGGARPIIRARDLRPDVTKPYEPAPGISYYPRAAVSMDGRWVALASCRPSGCDLIAAPTSGGALADRPTFAFDEQIVGIAGDLLIGSSSACEQVASCDGFVVDLRSGTRSPLGGAADIFDPIQLIGGPNGPLVLGQLDDYKAGHWQVEALDLTNRTRSITFAATYTPIDFTVRLAEWRQAELPVGWFLIYRNSTGAPSPEPDFSAGTVGGKVELPLPIMTIPTGDAASAPTQTDA